MSQVILSQTAVSKNLQGRLSTDEACTLSVPSPENGIVAFLFGLGQRPWNSGSDGTSLGLIMLLEGLLEGKAALKLLRG